MTDDELEKAAEDWAKHPMNPFDCVTAFRAGAEWMFDYIKGPHTNKELLSIGELVIQKERDRGKDEARQEILGWLRSGAAPDWVFDALYWADWLETRFRGGQ